MKKISCLALASVLFAGAASAEFVEGVQTVTTGPGGFIENDNVIVTVKQAKEMRDEVPVVIEGFIIKRVGDEEYLFEDVTDSIVVEIDDDDWRGQNIAPTDKVRLRGDVDKGLFTTEVEVDYVEKI